MCEYSRGTDMEIDLLSNYKTEKESKFVIRLVKLNLIPISYLVLLIFI